MTFDLPVPRSQQATASSQSSSVWILLLLCSPRSLVPDTGVSVVRLASLQGAGCLRDHGRCHCHLL
jgi:hypothetical protein